LSYFLQAIGVFSGANPIEPLPLTHDTSCSWLCALLSYPEAALTCYTFVLSSSRWILDGLDAFSKRKYITSQLISALLIMCNTIITITIVPNEYLQRGNTQTLYYGLQVILSVAQVASIGTLYMCNALICLWTPIGVPREEL